MKNKFGPGDCVLARFENGDVLVTRVECIWFRGESGVSYGVKGYDKTIAEENLCANEADLDKVKVVPYYEHPLC